MPRPKPENEKAILSVQVDKVFKEEILEIARRRGMPYADLVRELLRAAVGLHEGRFGSDRPDEVMALDQTKRRVTAK